eukprot:PhM_4_TR16819/c0_g1_i6/m.104721
MTMTINPTTDTTATTEISNNNAHNNISITSINIRSHINLQAVVTSCPSDILLVTELNAKASDLRGIRALMLSHGYNTHMHRSEYVRTAIFLRRHVRLLTGTSDPNLHLYYPLYSN